MKNSTKLHIVNMFLIALGLSLVIGNQFANLNTELAASKEAVKKEWTGSNPFRSELIALYDSCVKGDLLNGDGEKNVSLVGCDSTVEYKIGKPIQGDLDALYEANNRAKKTIIEAAPLPVRWLVE